MLKSNKPKICVASEMDRILGEDSFKRIFSTANDKSDWCEECEGVCDGTCKVKEKKATDFNTMVEGIIRISEMLDNMGLVKSSVKLAEFLDDIVDEASNYELDKPEAEETSAGENLMSEVQERINALEQSDNEVPVEEVPVDDFQSFNNEDVKELNPTDSIKDMPSELDDLEITAAFNEVSNWIKS